MSPVVPRVLSIAGTDPSGGAGVHADLKSITAAGGYGMAVTTSLVAQNTRGVREVHTPPLSFLGSQLDAVFDDVEVDAVKIGMLGDAATVGVVRDYLNAHRPRWVVLDPVMVATSGNRLLDADAEDALRDFVADVDVVTPNIPELAVLCRTEPAFDVTGAVAQARGLAARTGTSVVVKAGHLTGPDAGNTLVQPDGKTYTVSAPRHDTTCTHGTGCSLSSALATRLVVSGKTEQALEWVTGWLNESIAEAHLLEVGGGHGPVDHGHRARRLARVADTTPWRHLLGPVPDGDTPETLVIASERSAPTPGVSPAGPWTAALWEATGDIWAEIMELPLITGLRDGHLAEKAFTFYLDQDAHYLDEYARALAALAVNAPETGDRIAWAQNAVGCILGEAELHRSWLTDRERIGGPSPVTTAYTDFLRANTLGEDHVVGAAAVLPCFWLYVEIGLALAEHNHPEHPYHAWLTEYAAEEFVTETRAAVERVERALAAASPRQRVRAARAYLSACVHEREFFGQADRFGVR
ncbi:bifunctional hydroxymethylpyrimidine kinase/phosphomethylpyrimidine kinase [Corynebacterium sp. P7202]|uniref:Thiamine biosynthesis multifunctional protein ThiED n=1 Tax=Corynebacterium pygosceleis TaxID=2800406 RepID=A0A9Q4GHY3_9CORY|nr:bifunctional hydroxymethylpyrimidine kinase/phosphomethylpyrimidine kinase [Corynebacterium pygosceleis]MCK7637099.1 bifunctional hydroxymethylpyrimidine kinase/phosphomethylpyrimidine kinase [Corynebacterium pygosceleis]MCX7467853.1 bifunctional hydroxymethylpyrimidine kinase/phosphomethylpyrimidine kinase [Corynebacterium pygosceleis]